MQTSGIVWQFYDLESNQYSRPMDLAAAQVFILENTKKNWQQVYLWTPGWDDWYSVESFLVSDQNYFVRKAPELNIQSFTAVSTNKTQATSSWAEKRNHQRHDFKLEVVLVSKTRTFRTRSQNISLGGTLLEDEIPKDFFSQPFDLLIVNTLDPDPKTNKLLFKAKILSDSRDTKRLMFQEQDPMMTRKLEAMLNAYSSYQNNLAKKVG